MKSGMRAFSLVFTSDRPATMDERPAQGLQTTSLETRSSRFTETITGRPSTKSAGEWRAVGERYVTLRLKIRYREGRTLTSVLSDRLHRNDRLAWQPQPSKRVSHRNAVV